MNAPSNLPPGVTDKMSEDSMEAHCSECGEILDEEIDLEDICVSCNRRLSRAERESERLDDPRRGQAEGINRKGER